MAAASQHFRNCAWPVALLALLCLTWAERLPAQAVYVSNYTTSNVAGYLVNPATGVLTAAGGPTVRSGTSPIQALIHPSGKFLYVLNAGSGDISAYAINAPSGALTSIACPLCVAMSPSGMAVHPSGESLFVTNLASGSVTPYLWDKTTGALTIAGAPGRTRTPAQLGSPAIDPAGRYLYVADSGTNQVFGFAISPSGLAPVPGSPFAAGSGPLGIAASSSSVFVANQYSADVTVYQIGPGGTLSPSGVAVPAGGTPTSIAVDPSGLYVYVTNRVHLVAFNTFPNGPFALTQVRAYNAGTTPFAVAVDPDGRFVYATNIDSNDVSGFAISAGGTLLPLGSIGTFGAIGARSLTVQHIGDTTAISAAPGSPGSPAEFGVPVELGGRILNTRNPATVPLGSVTFTVNGSPAPNGTVGLNASGAFALRFNGSSQFLPLGQNVIQLAYNPGPGFEAPAPFPIAYTVTKGTPVLTTTYAPPVPIASQPMTTGVSVPLTGGRFPSGTAQFSIDGSATGGPVTLVNGTAAVSYTPAPGLHTVRVAYSGDSHFLAANAPAVTFRAMQSTTIAVSSSLLSPVYGEVAKLTATIGAGGRAVTGTVEFFDGGSRIGAAPVSHAGGINVAEFSTAFASAGQHSITAAYSGDTDDLPSNSNGSPLGITVRQAAVVVSRPAASGNATYGQPLTLTATVAAAAPGSGIPAGTVSFKEGTATLGTAPLAGGTARMTLNLSAGTHFVTAAYGGDANFVAGTSVDALQVVVAQAAPTLAVTAAPASAVVGQQVNLTAVLTGAVSAGGTVDFVVNGSKAGSGAVSASSATFSYAAASPATYTLTAAYGGDSNHKSAAGSATLTVNKGAVVVSPASLAGDPTAGMRVTLSATVLAAAPASGVPAGSVTFHEGATILGTQPVAAGVATLSLPWMTAGLHLIRASYGGDDAFLAGTSSVATLTIAKATTTTSLSVTQSGTSSTLTAIVSAASGTVPPSGTVLFLNGTKSLGTAVLAAGTGASATATLAVGQAAGSIAAVYAGDGNFNGSTSAAGRIEPRVTLELNATPSPAMVDQPVTVTARLAWNGSTPPAGAVEFYDGPTLLRTAPAAEQVAITVFIGAGDHSIEAVYTGDATYPRNSRKCALTVNKLGALAVMLESDVTAAVSGQTVTLVAKVSSQPSRSAPAPTGQVLFLDGAVALGTARLIDGVASGRFANLGTGQRQMSAQYSGDGNWASAVSRVVTVKVEKAATVTAVSAAPGPSGNQVSITATLRAAPPGAGAPSGTVQFIDADTGNVVGSAALTGGSATASVAIGAEAATVVAVYGGDAAFAGSSSAPAGQYSVRNSASYARANLAPDQIATVFAPGLAVESFVAQPPLPTSLGGVTLTLIDSTGASRRAQFFHVTPTQLSFLVPSGTAPGPATLRIAGSDIAELSAVVMIGSVSPGVFSANSGGNGPASAQIVRVREDGSQDAPLATAAYDSATRSWSTVAIQTASPPETLCLVLYATGIRRASSTPTVTIEGQAVPVLYAGAQPTFTGLDQVNVLLPANLKGAGTVRVTIAVDGLTSNPVTLYFQ